MRSTECFEIPLVVITFCSSSCNTSGLLNVNCRPYLILKVIKVIASFVLSLQDSGGFQMVSLLALAEITEEGVKFQSPHDKSDMMLTPEKSIEIQNSIGKVFIIVS